MIALWVVLGAVAGFAVGGAFTLWRLPRILSVMTPDQWSALMDRVDAEDKRGVDS